MSHSAFKSKNTSNKLFKSSCVEKKDLDIQKFSNLILSYLWFGIFLKVIGLTVLSPIGAWTFHSVDAGYSA